MPKKPTYNELEQIVEKQDKELALYREAALLLSTTKADAIDHVPYREGKYILRYYGAHTESGGILVAILRYPRQPDEVQVCRIPSDMDLKGIDSGGDYARLLEACKKLLQTARDNSKKHITLIELCARGIVERRAGPRSQKPQVEEVRDTRGDYWRRSDQPELESGEFWIRIKFWSLGGGAIVPMPKL